MVYQKEFLFYHQQLVVVNVVFKMNRKRESTITQPFQDGLFLLQIFVDCYSLPAVGIAIRF